MKKNSKKRFAAKLLFQFRVQVAGDSGKRRICEQRIVVITAKYAKSALLEAKKKGRAAEHNYKNNEDWPVYFEFIGVMELLCLDPACENDEVWFEIVERILPMERKQRLLPQETKLNAIRNKD